MLPGVNQGREANAKTRDGITNGILSRNVFKVPMQSRGLAKALLEVWERLGLPKQPCLLAAE
jgi:hypothetical protein